MYNVGEIPTIYFQRFGIPCSQQECSLFQLHLSFRHDLRQPDLPLSSAEAFQSGAEFHDGDCLLLRHSTGIHVHR